MVNGYDVRVYSSPNDKPNSILAINFLYSGNCLGIHEHCTWRYTELNLPQKKRDFSWNS